MSAAIRVELPSGLRVLAGIAGEITLCVQGAPSQASLLDALEAAYPVLRGTIRDHGSQLRRPFIRFFACQQDFSHAAPDAALPEGVVQGREVFLIVGAIVGG